ncbi:MAG: ATP-binding protein [Candidatus Acidiferrales bacterium]
MGFVAQVMRQLFSSGNFEPHGYCYLWNPGLVWLHVISDSLIAAAYFAIPVVLVLFIRRRRDLPFSWMFVLFGVFIVACGSTHLMEVWNLWHGNYWLAGVIKAATAAASVPTAVLLARLMPEAVDLPSFSQWIKANAALKAEILERKEAELNLRISEASFREQAEEIRKLNSELSQKLVELGIVNRELESFSYSVSHDLRTPLRHIDGFARILKEEHAAELSQEGCRYIDRVVQAANHMGHLVDDLLNLARIGRKEMVRQRVRLDELVREAMADLPPEISERQIEWKIEPLAEADCDPGLVKLVLVNLLSNAVKFTKDRQPAVIEVATRDTEKGKAFVVRDNGVGFDPKYADKLFGVFQRLHREEDFAGTGIGLATVQRIVHRHGGEVWAESTPGKGAAFFFTLEPRPRRNHAGTSTNGEVKLVRN